ncbi:hypothetical protein [Streptomyces sp. NPDC053431]|uniref:hypothetical protein n=1 Tax=Streptomyces sp. NPDC053431 TaxID=3365703 RepID=UPI0037D300E6
MLSNALCLTGRVIREEDSLKILAFACVVTRPLMLLAGLACFLFAVFGSRTTVEGGTVMPGSDIIIGDLKEDSRACYDGFSALLDSELLAISHSSRQAAKSNGCALRGNDKHHDVYQDRAYYVWDDSRDRAALRDGHGRTVNIEE